MQRSTQSSIPRQQHRCCKKPFRAAAEGQQHCQCLHINALVKHDFSSWAVIQSEVPFVAEEDLQVWQISSDRCRCCCRVSTDLGSFVGLGDSPAGSGMGSSGGGSLAPSPFRLPATYEEAKERKVAAVSDLRNAVKAVWLDFCSPLHLVKTSWHILCGLAHGGASLQHGSLACSAPCGDS